MDIKEVLLLWFKKIFDKKSASLADKSAKGSGFKSAINNEINQNEQFAKELNKIIIRKFEKTKLYSSFKDNIWGADLADMQLISKFNKKIRNYNY